MSDKQVRGQYTQENRHRGQPGGCAPATPPGVRVRTGRFEKLRSCESGYANAVEIRNRQHAMQV